MSSKNMLKASLKNGLTNTRTANKKTILPYTRLEMENNRIKVTIVASVNSTEDRQKVIFALNNIFPNSELIEKKNNISTKMDDLRVLEKIKEKIRSKKS